MPDTTPAQAPETAEEWLGCPRCHARTFTVTSTDYGLELGCPRCPTFIAVRLPEPVSITPARRTAA